jgi:hypothetical protein
MTLTLTLTAGTQFPVNSVFSNSTFSDFSDHSSQSVGTLGPERPVFRIAGTSLRQGQLPRPSGDHVQLTGQLTASTRRQPYPTHWVTGSVAARRHSSDHAPRPGNRCIWLGSHRYQPHTTRQPPHTSRQPLHTTR